jgi:phosphopantothenoylcysteine decarboxylase/phosphopantothenate--cysteine ligase
LNNAISKLNKKNLDWIVANDVKRNDIGFGANENAVTMISKTGKQIQIEKSSKDDIAYKIITNILN